MPKPSDGNKHLDITVKWELGFVYLLFLDVLVILDLRPSAAAAASSAIDLLFFDLEVFLLAPPDPPDVVDVGISLEGPGTGSSSTSMSETCV